MARTQLAPVSIESKPLRLRFVSFYCGKNYKSVGLSSQLPASSFQHPLPASSFQFPASSSRLPASSQSPVSSSHIFPVVESPLLRMGPLTRPSARTVAHDLHLITFGRRTSDRGRKTWATRG